MNQSQRKFLIDKIKEKGKRKIQKLKEELIPWPDLNLLLLHHALKGDIELKTNEELKKLVMNKAKTTKAREDWMGNRMGGVRNSIQFNVKDFFEIPDQYQEEMKRTSNNNEEIQAKIKTIENEMEMLELRIQLASPSILQKMISEVDDMGELSLVNQKLINLLN